MIFPGRSFVHPVHTLTNTLTNTINQIIKYYYKHKLESGRSNYHSLQFQSSKLQVAALAVAMGQSHPQSSGELGATRSTASAILDATYWVFLAARPCESRTRRNASGMSVQGRSKTLRSRRRISDSYATGARKASVISCRVQSCKLPC